MKKRLRIALTPDAAQRQRLQALQQAFAAACNLIAPMAQQTRCWNRVALHHMAYRSLRDKHPELGSQMACNAIYSVSRTCRAVYQNPKSPFHHSRFGGKTLPLVTFKPEAPVFFDRHTLSIKAGEASMYTLDGRMRFRLGLTPEDEQRFRNDKLREIVLGSASGHYALSFFFSEGENPDAPEDTSTDLPEYVIVIDPDLAPGALPRPTTAPAHPAAERIHP